MTDIWLVVTHSGDGAHAFRQLEHVFSYVRNWPNRDMTVYEITGVHVETYRLDKIK